MERVCDGTSVEEFLNANDVPYDRAESVDEEDVVGEVRATFSEGVRTGFENRERVS